jgi:chromosome segregation ATPase
MGSSASKRVIQQLESDNAELRQKVEALEGQLAQTQDDCTQQREVNTKLQEANTQLTEENQQLSRNLALETERADQVWQRSFPVAPNHLVQTVKERDDAVEAHREEVASLQKQIEEVSHSLENAVAQAGEREAALQGEISAVLKEVI